MGSTYLDLTNRVLRRLNEVELTMSNFAGARGIHATAKDAVLDSVRKINAQKFEWPFNIATGTQVLTVGQEEYTWPIDLRVPDWESFYIEKDTNLNINTIELKRISKEQWYHYARPQDYDAGTDGRNIPRKVFETDSGGFGVTPSPNEQYTVKYKYFIRTINLTSFSSVCTIPDEYDYVITDGALHYMYVFLDNEQRASIQERDFKTGLNHMAQILLPKAPSVIDTRINLGGSTNNGYYWGE